MLTKDEIVKLLETNDKAIARALVVLFNNQTADEQRAETTKYNNGIGFKSCHGEIGTSMAKFYLSRNYLSPKQVAYWRKRNKDGEMRISCYWRQLAEAAEAKKATQVVKPAAQPVVQVHPDEIEMRRMEVEHDRLQSQKEEFLKQIHKRKLERA